MKSPTGYPLAILLLCCIALFSCDGTTLDDEDESGSSSFTVYTADDGLADNTVVDILADYVRGGVWVATLNGVSYLSATDSTSVVYGADSDIPNMETTSLAFNSMTADIWLGTVSGPSVYSSDWTALADMDSLVHRYVTSLAVQPDGTIWFGSVGGVSVYNSLSGWRNFTSVNGLPGDVVSSIAIDATNKVWVGTTDGLTYYDGAEWTLIAGSSISSPVVNVLYRTFDGTVWCGTVNGISAYDGASWKKYGTADGIPSPVIHDFVEDWTHNLWVATEGGLCMFAAGSWHDFDLPDEVNAEPVTALAADLINGIIWIGTPRGLVRYTPETE